MHLASALATYIGLEIASSVHCSHARAAALQSCTLAGHGGPMASQHALNAAHAGHVVAIGPHEVMFVCRTAIASSASWLAQTTLSDIWAFRVEFSGAVWHF